MSDFRPNSLLHKVQMSRIFSDSKTFVDMTLKDDVISTEDVLQRFDDLMKKSDQNPDKTILLKFVQEHFTLENQLEKWEPQDWKIKPNFLEVIQGAYNPY
jgi:hypothetical protein